MHRAAFVVFDGFQLLDTSGPAAVFEIACHFGARYSVSVVSTTPGLVRSSSGIALEAKALASARAETIIVPGADRLRDPLNDKKLTAFLRRSHQDGRRVASVCSGAFLLAGAGLLDGRRAATHWGAAPRLQQLHPAVKVDSDSIFVEDRNVWTSAGVTAGIDLALAMVGRDYGEDTARKVARKMVVYHRRPGAQSQHSALLEMVTPDSRFASLLAWARERLTEPLSVEQLAGQASLSVRQFTRAFTAETGFAPAKAVERLRVEAARAAFESGETSLDRIARKTGFGSADRMRRSFVRILGKPPTFLKG